MRGRSDEEVRDSPPVRASGRVEGGDHPSVALRSSAVEVEWFEGRLHKLQAHLASRPLRRVPREKRTGRELGEGDRRDRELLWYGIDDRRLVPTKTTLYAGPDPRGVSAREVFTLPISDQRS